MPHSANSALTPKQLETLRMLAVEGLSVAAIAKRSNCHESSIRQRLYQVERKVGGIGWYNTVYLTVKGNILK